MLQKSGAEQPLLTSASDRQHPLDNKESMIASAMKPSLERLPWPTTHGRLTTASTR